MTTTYLPPSFLVFDVESVGLHGEGFAVGLVVVDSASGDELDSGFAHAHEDDAMGLHRDREWVREHVIHALVAHVPAKKKLRWSPGIIARDARTFFWDTWMYWKSQGAWLAADVPWPVEARFLTACVDDDRRRADHGPYPLVDVASVRLAAGLDPIGNEPRDEYEQPAHHPLSDARQSARLLIEALKLKR